MATIRIRIGPADNGRRMTLEEFWDAETQSGYHYELARGVLEVTQVPGESHYQIIHNLHEMFSEHRRQHPGLILRIGRGSDVQYVFPELEIDRNPDLAVVFREIPTRDVRGRRLSVLGVEVISPGVRARERDYVDKRADYLAVGLLEYWIVDPDEKRVTVLVRRKVDGVAGWEERSFEGDVVIVSDLLPGFAGTVAELWADTGDAD